MDNKEIESLVDYLVGNLHYNKQLLLAHVQAWQISRTPSELLTFEVVALYDKGMGPECMTLPPIKVNAKNEAQNQAERLATEIFDAKFRGKVEWQEVKIRPVK